MSDIKVISIGGESEYESLCDMIMEETQAQMCTMIVIEGNKGNGFSTQSRSLQALHFLPSILRSMADSMEKQMKRKLND